MNNTVTKDYLDQRLQESLETFGNKLAAQLAGQINELLEPRFKAIEDRLDNLDSKFDQLMVTLDTFLKRLDNMETENAARDAQLARLERWIETIAKQTGVKLEY